MLGMICSKSLEHKGIIVFNMKLLDHYSDE